MRMLMEIHMPNAPFNAAVKDGSVGGKMQKILAELKPEAAYFTELGGERCGILIVNIDQASQIPSLCEPWFQLFEAKINLRPAMTPDDLAHANLDALGKKWA